MEQEEGGMEQEKRRDGGIVHPLQPPPAVAGPPQPQDTALGSLELLMGLGWSCWRCCSSPTWGGSPQQFQLGWEQGGTSPVLGITHRGGNVKAEGISATSKGFQRLSCKEMEPK